MCAKSITFIFELHIQELVSTIDFRYITDVITPNEAIELLTSKESNRFKRQVQLESNGYPAYTTQIGTFKTDIVKL